jgi:hypothetical protein
VKFFKGVEAGLVLRDDVVSVPAPTSKLEKIFTRVRRLVHSSQQLSRCKITEYCDPTFKDAALSFIQESLILI